MGSKALLEFVTQCVANSNRFLKIRREASDESISATRSHLFIASNWIASRSKFDLHKNKSDAV
jgi:hypothetical protein